jgi:hypothetical protein
MLYTLMVVFIFHSASSQSGFSYPPRDYISKEHCETAARTVIENYSVYPNVPGYAKLHAFCVPKVEVRS